MSHLPVLLNEVVDALLATPGPIRFGLDVTFGRGGHTRELLRRAPQLVVTALDRDPAAIAFGKNEFAAELAQSRLHLQQQSFHLPLPLPPAAGWDVMLADLGVSSPQLDEAARGFSFYQDGPLDMRMDPSGGITAADIVNRWSPEELERLFRDLGEVRRPGRAVARIVERRRERPLQTTRELAELIERAEGWRKKGFHPATQYFLALRLEVNEEISQLEGAVNRMMDALRPGGRLAVITFHSLEDRIIKYAFKNNGGRGAPVNKKVIVPSRAECLANVRARSAKLRVFQRGGIGES